jgi:hypothetical protein
VILVGENTSNIPELNLDSRYFIQEAMEDCFDAIVDYNMSISGSKELYWLTYKDKFFKPFQKVYLRVNVALQNDREQSQKLDALMKEIDAWMIRMRRVTGEKADIYEMDKGPEYLFKLRPYLMLQNLYVLAPGVIVSV